MLKKYFNIHTNLIIALLVFTILATLSFVTYSILINKEYNDLEQGKAILEKQFVNSLEEIMYSKIEAIERLAGRWQHQQGTPDDLWAYDTNAYLEDFDYLYAIAIFNTQLKQTWLNTKFKGKIYYPLVQELDKIKADTPTYLSNPIKIKENEKGFWLLIPIIDKNKKITKYIGALVSYQSIFNITISKDTKRNYYFEVTTGSEVIYKDFTSNTNIYESLLPLSKTVSINILNATLNVRMIPSQFLLSQFKTSIPLIIFLAGLLISLLASLLIKLLLSNKDIQNKTSLILNSAGDGIYGLDLDGKPTFINPAALGMLGYKSEELQDKVQHDIIQHSKADGTPIPIEDSKIYKTYTQGRTISCNNEVFWRKDGTPFPVEYNSTPIKNIRGQLEGAVLTFRELSKDAARIRSTLYKFSESLDSIKDPIAWCNKEGIIVWCNDEFANIAEQIKMLIYNKNISEIISLFDNSNKKLNFSSLFRSINNELTIEGYLKTKGKNYLVKIFPFQDDEEIQYNVILQDISLIKTNEILASNKSMLEMFGILHARTIHEISTPFQVLLNNLSIFEYSSKNKDHKFEESELKEIISQNNTCKKQVHELLEKFRRDLKNYRNSNFEEINDESLRINLHEIINNVISIMLKQTQNISIQSNVSEVKIICPEKKAYQLFFNLIKNAIEAIELSSPEKDTPGEIIISSNHIDKERKIAEISILDNGCGISENNLNKIYDLLYTTKSTGSGIGMGIVKNIVEEVLDGSVNIQSELGKWTKITLTIPTI